VKATLFKLNKKVKRTQSKAKTKVMRKHGDVFIDKQLSRKQNDVTYTAL